MNLKNLKLEKQQNKLPFDEISVSKGFTDWETGFISVGKPRTVKGQARIAYRVKGSGPTVILVHGWPLTGYEMRIVAEDLARDHRVIVPDYRGAGSSSTPDNGYDMKTMGNDLLEPIDHLEVDRLHVVGHDIGLSVSTALTLLAGPERVISHAVMESNLPGMPSMEHAIATGSGWHYVFHGYVNLATTMTKGKEFTYFQHFYDEKCARMERVSFEDRAYYAATYANGDRLRASYQIYGAFPESGKFFQSYLGNGKGVGVPAAVFAGEFSMAPDIDRIAADIGTTYTRIFSNTGHFIPEENPEDMVRELRNFWKTV